MGESTPEDREAETALDKDWVQRPFARTFDLIASEYGYTDDYMLDLTLRRMRQMREVILIRKAAEWRKRVNLEELKSRVVTSAVHGAAGNKKGAKQAFDLKFIPDEDDENDGKRPKINSEARVAKVFKKDPLFPVYTEEDILEEARRQREAGLVNDG